MTESTLTRQALERLGRALSRLALTESNPTTVLLIRHGEAAPRETADGYQDDPGLSEHGQWQARRLGQRLRERTIHAVYTSPLRRTRETARTLGERLDQSPRSLPAFREIGYASDKNGNFDAFVQTGRWSAIDGFEADEDLRGRVREGLNGLRRKHPGRRVVVVTHMLPINAALADRLEADRSVFFRPDLASVTEVRLGDPGFFLVRLADTDHLPDDGDDPEDSPSREGGNG